MSEAFIAEPQPKRLDRIGERACVKAPQGFKSIGPELRFHWEANRPIALASTFSPM